MPSKLPYPEFGSETEEADWLYEHREELDLYFSPMAGSVREMLLTEHRLILPDETVSVPMTKEDLARAKFIAASKGLEASEYIGQMVHEALRTKHAA